MTTSTQQQQWNEAFKRPQESFKTTCPLFGGVVTRLALPDDFYLLMDEQGGCYRIEGSVRTSDTKDQLTDAHRERLRDWIRERRAEGEERPMITDNLIRRIVIEQDDD